MEEILEQPSLYWAFPIELSIQREVRSIALTLHGSPLKGKELDNARKQFIHGLNSVIDAGFEFYYQTPANQDGNLSPLAKRTVDSLISTVRHAIHLVVQRIFKKTPLHELMQMGNYLDSMIIKKDDRAYLAYPFSNEIRAELASLQRVILLGDFETTESYEAELVSVFSSIIKDSIHYYYHEPTGLLKLNRFVKKAADVGMNGVASGIEKVIHRVIKDVSHEQITLLFENLDMMLLAAEPNYPVASTQFIPDKSVGHKENLEPA